MPRQDRAHHTHLTTLGALGNNRGLKMSSSGDTFGEDPTQAVHRASGRAAFGADGRSIWEWQTSTGVFTRDVTDEQLNALQATHLELVDPGEAITVRRAQTALRPTPMRAATRAAAAASGGKVRRLLRWAVRLLS
jgi:hypothetical protein